METLLPAQVPSLDCVERFLYDHHNIHNSNSPASSPQSQLPPICDLESKVLCDLLFVQEEEAAQHQQQQQQPRTPPVTVPDMENRMSPDSSSVEWHLQQQQQHPHQHQHNSLAHLAQLSSPASSMVSSPMSSSASSTSAMPQPDSTTNDVHYDSDAFNSEDSTHTDEDENSNPILLQRQMEPVVVVVPVVAKKKKKSKRAGDVLLRCEEAHCGYTTRFKEHLTSHMHTHRADRNYMCHDCGQTFKWSHSLKRHQRTHRPADQVTFLLIKK